MYKSTPVHKQEWPRCCLYVYTVEPLLTAISPQWPPLCNSQGATSKPTHSLVFETSQRPQTFVPRWPLWKGSTVVIDILCYLSVQPLHNTDHSLAIIIISSSSILLPLIVIKILTGSYRINQYLLRSCQD